MIFRTYNSYLKSMYHTECGKLCIDGGFTCPNRDGTCGEGGCRFCGERGAGEHLCERMSVRAQVEDYFSRPHRQKKFVAYFQNFTGTYAPPEVLRQRYTDALCDERIVALSIGTRPDCLGDEALDVLCELRRRTDVWVELGLQTTNDQTAAAMNRGYKTEVFFDACRRLRARNIPFAVHLMFGLPNETEQDMRATVEAVAAQHPFGVKFHALYVMDGTALADDYRAGRYTPPDEEFYIERVIDALCRLPEDTVILRLTSDCPADRLLAPAWNTDKPYIHDEIRRRMTARTLHQGMLFK